MKKERIEGKEIEIECEPEPEPEAVSVPMVQVSFQARGKDSGSGIECRLGRLPIVVLSAEALAQMLGYLSATRLEVSALGAVIALLVKKHALGEILPKEIIFDLVGLRLSVEQLTTSCCRHSD